MNAQGESRETKHLNMFVGFDGGKGLFIPNFDDHWYFFLNETGHVLKFPRFDGKFLRSRSSQGRGTRQNSSQLRYVKNRNTRQFLLGSVEKSSKTLKTQRSDFE